MSYSFKITTGTSMPRRTILLFASIFGILALLAIGAVIFFETYGQSPAIQSRFQATQTAEAAQAIAGPTRLASRQLVFDETFESGTLALDVELASIKNGAYQTEIRYPGVFHVLSSAKTLTDFIAEVECTVFGSLGQCGIAFGAQYDPNGKLAGFYSIYLTGDGYGFRGDPLEGFQTGFTKTLSAVKPGAINLLRIVRIGQEARVYINEQEIDRIELTASNLGSGEIGLYVGLAPDASPTEFVSITADNVRVWEIPGTP
jgi:hypothetical protein